MRPYENKNAYVQHRTRQETKFGNLALRAHNFGESPGLNKRTLNLNSAK